MKTILRILVILLVASIVAGAFSFAVNKSLKASSPKEGEQPPVMSSTAGQDSPPMEQPGVGDYEGVPFLGGRAGVLGTLVKLAGITIFILLIQKAFSLLGSRKLISIQQ